MNASDLMITVHFYAMKRLNRVLMPRTLSSLDTSGEIEIMKRLRNEYVVRLYEVIDDALCSVVRPYDLIANRVVLIFVKIN